MLLESLRGFDEAGDCGILWKVAGGGVYSEFSGMPGDMGLLGLMGALALSLAPLVLMASERADDLGMFSARAACRGALGGGWAIGRAGRWWCQRVGRMGVA